jgi:hydroxymethylbilane synthase
MEKIIIGTRGSELALAQTEMVKRALIAANSGLIIEVKVIKTEGDRKQETPLAAQSDKKDWIVDLERALIQREIDLAVHSGKDVPGELEVGTSIRSILKRANPRDVFIGRMIDGGQRLPFKHLPPQAVIGTASLRRRASLLAYRRDLELRDHRGNVPTRIQKLDRSQDLSGIVIAAAGLERLGLCDVEREVLEDSVILPAMNQGALIAQVRTADQRVDELIHTIVDQQTEAEFAAERAVSDVLGGDCHSAISIFAQVRDDSISVEGRVFSVDGSQVVQYKVEGPCEKAAELGATVGRELIARGAAAVLR